jgi:hypothetical protein
MKATMLAQEKVLVRLREREVERISVKHELLPHLSTGSKLPEHNRRMR